MSNKQNDIVNEYVHERALEFADDAAVCRHCGHIDWDGECQWCEPNDMDDSTEDDNATNDRHAAEWESQTYSHYSGDNT